MAQSSFPFGPPAEAEDRSLLTALGKSTASENKVRRRFRQLVAKIEQRREDLQRWQDCILRFNQRVTNEIEPLRVKLVAAQRDMALLIDELLTRPAGGRKLARKHRRQLGELMTTLLLHALEDEDDEALNALREKYCEPITDEDRLLEMDLTRELLEVFGVEVDDAHGARNSEELMEYVRRQMLEREEAALEAERLRQARKEERARARPKSAKAQAAEAKREQAARAVSQSLREVFRKLASALHPDREPDPEERRRKNELMQEANRAYEANDLLTLLDLQLRIEQIDTAHLASLDPERLAHYNQVLREQLAELDEEVARVCAPFELVGFAGRRVTPADVDRSVDAEKKELREALEQLQGDLIDFRDPRRLRLWLDAAASEDEIFFNEEYGLDALFMSMHEAPASAPRPRRRKRAGKRRRG